MSITIPSSYMLNKEYILIKAENQNGDVFDLFTIYKLSNGSDAYSVIISSNNGTVFKMDSGVTESLVTCCVYKGSREISAKSYTWYYADNANDWIQLGTGREITLPLSTNIIKKRLKCKVEV